MIRAAQSAPSLLRDAAGRVASFLRSRRAPGRGFTGRDGRPDLYYTVFGAEGLIILGEPLVDDLPAYLAGFGDGEGLDFVHLACLARARADAAPEGFDEASRRAVADRLAAYRSGDGGFSHQSEAPRGTAYGCFLGVGAYEDLGVDLPDPEGPVRCLAGLEAPGGGWSNEPGGRAALTPATAAAVTLLAHLGRPMPEGAAGWLLGQTAETGGFRASPDVPVADLLSTATSLHALVAAGADPGPVREGCLRLLDTLWSEEEGAFRGHAFDAVVDCEYTWYGLLALGHLAA